MLSSFISEEIRTDAPGDHIPYDQFAAHFYHWLGRHSLNVADWPHKKIKAALRAEGFLIGCGPQGRLVIGNASCAALATKRFVQHGDKLRLESIEKQS